LKRYNTDVLIIGGGGAGLMAAYEATKYNVKVALVNKGKVQKTGATIMAPGAIAAVDDRWKTAGDSKELHIKDTIIGGSYLNDQNMVEIMAQNSPSLVIELERMGAIFQRNKNGDKYMLRIGGGHTYPRCPYLEDRTGREMVRTIVSELKKRNVPFYENIMITRLIKNNENITGATGINLNTLEICLFESKSIIIATGGAGSIYQNTDNSVDLTGDGYVLALEAGVALRDMEFVQFYPIGFLYPPSLKGMLGGLLYYCRLYNSKGERFMGKYDKERLELSTRDRVSRAIIQEVIEGRGTPLGGVYMDLTFNEPGFVKKMTPGLYETYINMGINPEKEYIEIAPTVHFFMGGLSINSKWETSIKGLYGAGETCGGMHGGNRLSQNALAEILVSGAISGRNAALNAMNIKDNYLDPNEAHKEEELLIKILSAKVGRKPIHIKKEVKRIMWDYVGVFRTGKSLSKALKEMRLLETISVKVSSNSMYMNKEVIEAIESRNMIILAKCIILSALNRKESRAAHYRSDYPEIDDIKYLRNFYSTMKEGEIIIQDKKVDLKKLIPEVKIWKE